MIAISFGQVVLLRLAELFADPVQPLVLTLLLPPRCWATRRKEQREYERLHCIECSATIFHGRAFTIERLWLWKLQRDLTTVDVFSVKLEVQARISTSSIASVAAMLTVVKSDACIFSWYLTARFLQLIFYLISCYDYAAAINYSTISSKLHEIFCWGNWKDNKIIGDFRHFCTCQTSANGQSILKKLIMWSKLKI